MELEDLADRKLAQLWKEKLVSAPSISNLYKSSSFRLAWELSLNIFPLIHQILECFDAFSYGS